MKCLVCESTLQKQPVLFSKSICRSSLKYSLASFSLGCRAELTSVAKLAGVPRSMEGSIVSASYKAVSIEILPAIRTCAVLSVNMWTMCTYFYTIHVNTSWYLHDTSCIFLSPFLPRTLACDRARTETRLVGRIAAPKGNVTSEQSQRPVQTKRQALYPLDTTPACFSLLIRDGWIVGRYEIQKSPEIWAKKVTSASHLEPSLHLHRHASKWDQKRTTEWEILQICSTGSTQSIMVDLQRFTRCHSVISKNFSQARPSPRLPPGMWQDTSSSKQQMTSWKLQYQSNRKHITHVFQLSSVVFYNCVLSTELLRIFGFLVHGAPLWAWQCQIK